MDKLLSRINKLFPSGIVFFTDSEIEAYGHGFHHKGKCLIHHSRLAPHETAFFRVSPVQSLLFAALVFFLVIALMINWHTTAVILIAVLTVVYFSDLLFNLFLIYRSFSKPPELTIPQEMISKVSDREWPSYTIFCPLYKEWDVLPQFVSAIGRIDYPKDKLQVLLLLEEDDVQTIKHTSSYNLPSYFEIVIVPHGLPKTKPKALNYGLRRAKGEYTVIYDAEDIPDVKQLKKAVLAFKVATPNTICIQAKLNFYNPHQNILTRVFTAEYSLWFDLVLTGLQSIHAPIPLGGTSNHFRTVDLHNLKGWDAFNVTEDCDLGIRIVKRGYRTAIIDSVTLEEANSSMINWFGQRTRWIKGYIQTYLVHTRTIHHFFRNWKNFHFITFQLVVGGKIMSLFINPLMWVVTASYFIFRSNIGTFIESFYPGPVLYMAFFSLIFGNFLYLYYYMIGCYKRGHHDLVKYALLVPFYWLAMSLAAWGALYSLVRRPHHWVKTKHGLHLSHQKAVRQVTNTIGTKLIDDTLVNPSTNGWHKNNGEKYTSARSDFTLSEKYISDSFEMFKQVAQDT